MGCRCSKPGQNVDSLTAPVERYVPASQAATPARGATISPMSVGNVSVVSGAGAAAGSSKDAQRAANQALVTRAAGPATGDPKAAVSGSYRCMGLELRVDVDIPANGSVAVLHMVSGDLFDVAGAFKRSFVASDVKTERSSDTVNVMGTARFFDDGSQASLTVSIAMVPTGQHTASLRLNDTVVAGAVRYASTFRQIVLEVDYAADEEVSVEQLLPSFDTGTHPSRPIDLPVTTHTLESVYRDAGLSLTVDTSSCNAIADPNPATPWLTSELHQTMALNSETPPPRPSQAGGDPEQWRVWMLVGGRFRSSRTAGLMFDSAGRKGFAVFRDHPWFALPDDASPEAVAASKRQYLHVVAHELGHALNLKHPWETGDTTSLSWMTYDWIYNQKHGPNAYFNEFRYTFHHNELMYLRHANRQWVFPGVSVPSTAPDYNVLALTPATSLPPDQDSDDRLASRLQLLARAQPGYDLMEVVQLELRLKNLFKGRITVNGVFDPVAGNVQIYVTQPSGVVLQAQPAARSSTSPKPVRLDPDEWAHNQGEDRFSSLIGICYSSSGFLFREPGRYSMRVTYDFADFHLVSNTVTFYVHANSSDADAPDTFFRPLVGEYIALGGSLAPRFEPVRKWLIDMADRHRGDLPRWLLSTLVFTSPGTLANGRVLTRDAASGKLSVHTAHPDQEALLSAFDDVLAYFHESGTPTDNLLYVKAVKMMAELLTTMGREDDATEAMEYCLDDLAERGVKPAAVERTRRKLMRAAGRPQAPTRLTDPQAFVDALLQWEVDIPDDDDTPVTSTDVLLSEDFSEFDDRHTSHAFELAALLWSEAEATSSLEETLRYAEDLMKGGIHNRQLVQHAVEVFVVHHPLCHAAGLRLNDFAQPYEVSAEAAASAMSPPDPRFPHESDMDYFRNDHEFNFHHRHWHAVYNGAGLPGSNRSKRYLDRQGELFVYMHTAMLARYNADRKSWGLPDVVPYSFDEVEPDGFFHSQEFHTSKISGRGPFGPRPAGRRWPDNTISTFRTWTTALRDAISTGYLTQPSMTGDGDTHVALTANWFGHALESTTSAFRDFTGNIHNSGHGVFGSMRDRGYNRGVMNSSVAAVRDPIFHRWHTFVDKLAEEYGDSRLTEIGTDAPKVSLDGVVVKRYQGDDTPEPPAGFGDVLGPTWTHKAHEFQNDDMLTTLAPPENAWEFGKMRHRPFCFHFRVSRQGRKPKKLDLTARVFACPAYRTNDRHSWIEMDKFKFEFPAGANHHVVTRKDVFSSVIRRTPDIAQRMGPEEGSRVRGFCECGWPYDMLLPRGTPQGMPFVWFVMLTNNELDTMGVCTECGSLSFCGTKDQKYPDSRDMGYPFATRMQISGKEVTFEQAVEGLPNAFATTIVVKNADTRWGAPDHPSEEELAEGKAEEVEPEAPAVAPEFQPAWAAQAATGVVAPPSFKLSGWVGSFRVLVVAADVTRTGNIVRLKFAGRTSGSPYTLTSITIAHRMPGTPNATDMTPVTFDGNRMVDVPPEGIESDDVTFDMRGTDTFVSFAVSSPSVYLPRSGHVTPAVASWVVLDDAEVATEATWPTSVSRLRPQLYALDSILVASDSSEELVRPVHDSTGWF